MNERQELFNLLVSDFERAKTANPSYSLRAYARRLSISPAALSGYLAGKLPLTSRSGERIMSSLGIDIAQRERILSGLKLLRSRSPRAPDAFVQLDMDHYHLISEWYAFAIVSLSETENFSGSTEWIAKRLSITRREARKSVQILIRLGLLQKLENGQVVSTGKSFKTTTGVAHPAIRFSHLKNLELMRRSLEQDSVDERDFTAMTMAIDPAKLPEAKRRITAFRRELSGFLESGEKKEVFRVCLGLFPLSGRKTA